MDKILTILEDIHVHKNADIFVLKDKIIRKKVDILGGEIHNMSGHESLETFAHFLNVQYIPICICYIRTMPRCYNQCSYKATG